MANNYRPFIPSRAKDGGPMTYAIVHEDGTETTVSKAELIASFDDLHPVYVNAEAGIAVRLPLRFHGRGSGFQTRLNNRVKPCIMAAMEPQKKEQEAVSPRIVLVDGKRKPAGSLDGWLRSLRQPGPPARFSKSAAELLHEARAEA